MFDQVVSLRSRRLVMFFRIEIAQNRTSASRRASKFWLVKESVGAPPSTEWAQTLRGVVSVAINRVTQVGCALHVFASVLNVAR
jgi:hypothetical protein